MRVATRFLLSIVFGLAWSVTIVAQPPSDEAIRRAIADLADERFPVRQRAFKLLVEAGDAAETRLRTAANSGDPEVARQARVLLERIAYRIDPGTPADIVELITRFRHAGVESEQTQIIRQLLSRGSRGHTVVLRLLDAVDERARRIILDGFAYDDWRILSTLIAQGQDRIVGELLDKALAAQNDSIISHYAAFQLQAGRLDTARAAFRDRAKTSNLVYDASVHLALARLAEAREEALDAARRAQDLVWVRQLLTELHRWDDLVREFPARSGAGPARVADLGHLAAYHRLTGRTDQADAVFNQIRDTITDPSGPRSNRPWLAAKALLANERVAEALETLQAHDQHGVAVDLLAGQARFADALQITERVATAETGKRYADRVMHIQLLVRLGETTRARDWLRRLERDQGDGTDPGWLDRYVSLLVQLNERPAAEKRLLVRIDRHDGSYLSNSFAALFPRLGARAELAWRMLSARHPTEKPEQLLARLRSLELGQMPPAEMDELLLRPVPANRHTNVPDLHGMARLVASLGRADVARTLLRHPAWATAPTDARLPLADTLARAGRWVEAADAYQLLWEADRAAPLLPFLLADARDHLKPGDPKANELRELSHRLPLGGDSVRHDFQEALAARGFADAAYREALLGTRLFSRNAWQLGAALEQLARSREGRGELSAAAEVLQQSILRSLAFNDGYHSASRYLARAADLHRLRAQVLLSQKKIDEALREMRLAESLHPAHLETAITLVPALTAAGQRDAAEQLATRVVTRWKQACESFPACARAHNNLAWLYARLRRNLDDALTHARRATELMPTSPTYLDTLAEVHFQRGERNEAIAALRRCLAVPGGDTPRARQQLTRFERGTPP